MIKPHKYDHRGCLDSGNNAEASFDNIAKKMGHNIMKATPEQDMVEKWDRLLYKGNVAEVGKMYKVEIKGMKRIKWFGRIQDKLTWVELHGVGEKDDGWLYGGKADIIAFEKSSKFILVDRTKLIDLVNKLVDFGNAVDDPEEAEYKVYHRETRPFEKSTLVELNKIEEIKFKEWDKVEDNIVGW